MFFCLSVPNDLVNRWNDMIHLYSEASNALGMFITILGDSTNNLLREITIKENIPLPQHPSQMPLEVYRDVAASYT